MLHKQARTQSTKIKQISALKLAQSCDIILVVFEPHSSAQIIVILNYRWSWLRVDASSIKISVWSVRL